MKKIALELTLILLLLASMVVVMLFVEVSRANFVPTSPAADPPAISILSPINKTYENEVLLHLNLTLRFPSYQEINYVCYTLDNQDYVVNSSYGKEYMNWSTILEGLPEGIHALQVTASCKSFYLSPTSGGHLYYRIYWSYSGVVNFTVVYPPQISILSPKSKTYDASNIQLDFTVDEQVSRIEYSLDGQKKVTIPGNATLNGLADGPHNVTIYAMDMDGNIGVSETIYFNVGPFSATLVLASVVLVAVIGISLLVYFKKRQRGSADNG